MDDLQFDVFAEKPRQEHAEFGQRIAELDRLGAQRLAAREGKQLPHERGRPVRILLDVHNVLEGRVARPMRGEEKIGEPDDGSQHIVEIMRDTAGELADRLHLLALGELLFQLALHRRLKRIDDRRLAIARAILDSRDVESGRAFARTIADEFGVDRRDIADP